MEVFMKIKVMIAMMTVAASVLAAPLDDKIAGVKAEIVQVEQKIKELRIHDNGGEFKKAKANKTTEEKELEKLKAKLAKLKEQLKRLETKKAE
jgi:chromosome segregation ATPase